MSAPRVSVIIATNRRGEYLGRALQSVADQDHPDHETIIVDDGSPDPGAIDRIAADFDGVRVIHQGGAGVSVARNVGIAASRGSYCAFLDDDDEWLPDRLSRQIAALQQDPAAVLAYGRVGGIDEKGEVIAAADQLPATDLHDVFDGSRVPQFQSVTVRRDALIRVGGFHSALRYGEDLDLMLRLARDGSFVFVDREVARYRRHGANVTASYRPLVRSLDAVIRMHAVRAEAEGDGTARDLRSRRRANGRYALWRAWGIARDAPGLRGARELWWAVRFAPLAPLDVIVRRIRRR